MEHPPIRDPRLIEAIEACRPGSDDLSDPMMQELAAEMSASPELRELFERLQRVDECLADAFRDVPVPEGLGQRVLVKVVAAAEEGHDIDAPPAGTGLTEALRPTASAEESSVPRLAESQGGSGHALRRRVFVGAMIAAAASLVAVVGIRMAGHTQRPLDLETAIGQFHDDAELHGSGQLVDQVAPPAAYPFSNAVIPYGDVRWREIRDFQGWNAIAYDIRSPRGLAATLYVIRGTGSAVPIAAPNWPTLTTAGLSAGAWQEGQVLCVLVVRGEPQDYRDFLNVDNGPLA